MNPSTLISIAPAALGVICLVIGVRATWRGHKPWPVIWILPAALLALTGEVLAIAHSTAPDGILPALEAAGAAWSATLVPRWSAAALAFTGGALAFALSFRTPDDGYDPLEISAKVRLRLIASLNFGLAGASAALAVSRESRRWVLEQALSQDVSLGWWVNDEIAASFWISWALLVAGGIAAVAIIVPLFTAISGPQAGRVIGLPLLALLAVGATRGVAEWRVAHLEDIGANGPVLDVVSHEVLIISIREIAGEDGHEPVLIDTVPIGDVVLFDEGAWHWRWRRGPSGWSEAEGVVDPGEISPLGHPMLLVRGQAPAATVLDFARSLSPDVPAPAIPFRLRRTEFGLHPLFAHLQVTYVVVRLADPSTKPAIDVVSGRRLDEPKSPRAGLDRASRVRLAMAGHDDRAPVLQVGAATVRDLWQACAGFAIPARTTKADPDGRRCVLVE